MSLTELVEVPAGEFTMGADDSEPEERPARRVAVSRFAMERHPVTNEQYAAFVDQTGYRTVAEHPLDPAAFPGAPAENLQPGSMVFTPTSAPVDLRHLSQWWAWTVGACWRHPDGPDSSWRDRAPHPVVHVAHEDAAAYAAWAGRDLPTEAQWERAARGGNDGLRFSWGDVPMPDGRRLAKYWEGDFPWHNDPSDGFERTAPVDTYPPNAFGLVDLTGNVWEWTDDWYGEARPDGGGCCIPRDPRGPGREASFDPRQPQFRIPRKVIKGGSFLCADEYCQRYRPSARRPQMIDTGMSHIGFRCIARSIAGRTA